MKELAPGQRFGRYEILGVAGRGGMGVVYRARQSRPSRIVALKILAPELAGDAGFRARFERECDLAASIEHPNVIPVYDVDEHDGLLFISMRYVEGTDLRELARSKNGLAPAEAAHIVAQVADALDAAHADGLVHRDVKPANVLLARSGKGRHAYLTDFGLTKAARGGDGLTRTGMIVGTWDYMAPEQFEGGGVDARTDVYSLGCVLYEALRGEAPFPREGEAAKMYAHLNADPPSLAGLDGVGPQLDAVIARAMAKAPGDRFQSAGDLGRAALAAAGGTPSAAETRIARGEAAPRDRATLGPPPLVEEAAEAASGPDGDAAEPQPRTVTPEQPTVAPEQPAVAPEQPTVTLEPPPPARGDGPAAEQPPAPPPPPASGPDAAPLPAVSRSRRGLIAGIVGLVALAAAAAIFVLVVLGGDEGSPGDLGADAVARVADTEIERAAFDHWLEVSRRSARAPGSQGSTTPTTEAGLRRETMEFLINAEWLEHEADLQGVEVTDAEVDREYDSQRRREFPTRAALDAYLRQTGMTEDDLRMNVRLTLLSNKLQDKASEDAETVTDAEIERYYERNKRRFARPATRDVNIVLTKNREQAEEALAALEGGESWKEVAARYSTDPATREQGGRLPGVSKGQQDPAFDEAVFGAEKGEFGGPVKTQFGWLVFQVTKVSPAEQQTLEEATPQIRRQLASEGDEEAQKRYVKEFERRWRPETVCRRAYAVSVCGKRVD